MKLRSRIMIITFLLIFFVQGFNCLLEIGFLADNLKKNNLRRFYVIGNEIRRKLNTSLIFGKPVSHLNFRKLLSNIIPQDIENLYVTDKTGAVVYSLRTGQRQEAHFPVSPRVLQEQIGNSYNISLPLENRSDIQGNIIMVVSLDQTWETTLAILRQSLTHFLIILGISLPMLYGLLTVLIERPYKKFVSDLGTWLCRGRGDRLHEVGIDISVLERTEEKIEAMRAAPFLADDRLFEQVDLMVPPADEQTVRNRIDNELSRVMGTG